MHVIFFFFNDTATTEIYTLSLHDALPISSPSCAPPTSAKSKLLRLRSTPSSCRACRASRRRSPRPSAATRTIRSEEHTSELQSLAYLVCRLLLEKKKYRH